ncbi:MAG: sulfatase [Phycisphaerae bacterium]|nr:sulfatase [Phycisphaerae bacterium]|tara:strand:+ start:2464 stop:3999 length:1536 start_codon:yes stop_codon:yes gene_type:complete
MRLIPLVIVAAPILLAGPDSNGSERPNILFIYTDDHSAAAVGAYGSRINRTPGMDRIAEEGMRFDNAFCTNGICAPCRAVVLTGTHSHVNGLMDNGDVFDGSQPTFPQLLRDDGYATALIGKWHLKTDPTGFDHWAVLPGQGDYYNPDFVTADGTVRDEGYVTDLVTDRSIDWLQREWDREKPFLLMCQHKAPHRSWMPGPGHLDLYEGIEIPEPATLFDDYATRASAAHDQEMEIDRHMYLHYDLKVEPTEQERAELSGPDRWIRGMRERLTPEQLAAWDAAFADRNEAFRAAGLEGRDLVRWKYQRYIKNYLRCIASVDDNVARLLDWLDAQGLAEDTIVVYSSDQGFFLGEHGWYDKRFMYEPSLRTPLLIRWPGTIAAGRTEDALVQNLDLAQTFLDVAGVPAPDRMQGSSLLPLLEGRTPDTWRESIYYEYFERGIHNVQPHRGVRTDRWKLIEYPDRGEWELFDLHEDPDEIVNLADDPVHLETRTELESELRRLQVVYGVPDGS